MSAAEQTEDLTLGDLGAANVQWSDQFLLLLKDHLESERLDTGKPIADAWRRTKTVSFLFDYPASKKGGHAEMRPHAVRCASKAWQETGRPQELRAKKAFLVHTADEKRCVVFAMFEYEYCVEDAPVSDFLRELAVPHPIDPTGYLEIEGDEAPSTPKAQVRRGKRKKSKRGRKSRKK